MACTPFNLFPSGEHVLDDSRLYGTPALARATRAQSGTVPPVLHRGDGGQYTPMMTNPVLRLQALQGTGVGCLPFLTGADLPFQPYAAQNAVALPVRPDTLIQTMHSPDAALKGTELLNPRVHARTEGRPDTLNLRPQMASEYCREKNVARLTRLHELYVKRRLEAAGTGLL